MKESKISRGSMINLRKKVAPSKAGMAMKYLLTMV